MTARDEMLFRAALLALPGAGPKTARKLAAKFHSARAAFEAACRGEVPKLRVNDPARAAAAEAMESVRRFLARGEQRAVLLPDDENYPRALLDLSDAPPLLFAHGDARTLGRLNAGAPAVAIVGSRQADNAGLAFARDLSRSLAGAGCVIVSGGAEGIDQAAHEGALAAGESDVSAAAGVLVAGGGLNALAREKRRFSFQFAARGGVAISEYLPDDPAPRGAYQKRNRIVAALARAVVLIEGEVDSGATITIARARKLGRTVAGWSGSSDAAEHLLAAPRGVIAAGGAEISSAAGVRALLERAPCGRVTSPRGERRVTGAAAARPEPPDAPPDLAGDERIVWEALGGGTARDVDGLIATAGIGAARTQTALVALELTGVIVRSPGNRYRRR